MYWVLLDEWHSTEKASQGVNTDLAWKHIAGRDCRKEEGSLGGIWNLWGAGRGEVGGVGRGEKTRRKKKGADSCQLSCYRFYPGSWYNDNPTQHESR